MIVRIRVKLFAILREKAGVAELELELPEGATVGNAVAALGERIPAIRESLDSVAFAVNRSYAGLTAILKDGDELAAIPPVSGG
ncbi:MAG TPA: molybdopterin converting factor subunit 1 [Tepidisphaeraceae bacterium]|nr:molybdopterin converting factor subunit 1 [Tepidisphaeraceae bacterium]